MPAALTRSASCPRGFTLIELAVVLAIVTMLLGGLALTLSAQLDLQHAAETRQTLDNVRDALVGFAAANGRLPCPATSTSNGQESPTGGGACTSATSGVAHGFVPGNTLGVTPVDNQGFVLDGWGFPIRYAVFVGTLNAGSPPTCNNTTTFGNVFTTAGRMRNATMPCMAGTGVNPLLYVCASSPGLTTPNCGTTVALTTKAPAVIYSTGKNTLTGGGGDDEKENPNPNSGDLDAVFVFHDPTAGGTGGAFDDMMTWISLPVLFNRMIAAGQLP